MNKSYTIFLYCNIKYGFKMSILKNLIRVANNLDGHSLIKEADILDSIIKKYADLLEEQYESSDYYIAYHCGKPDIESDFSF